MPTVPSRPQPADKASELYADELHEGMSDDLREALSAVERAEARIEQGTYGLSVESGRPIPDDRLDASGGITAVATGR